MFKNILKEYFDVQYLEKKDFLLIWGIIFAPFTALRILKFGPGEILLIIWMVIELKKNFSSIRLTFINYYQIYNLVVMAIGFCIEAAFYNKPFNMGIVIDYFSHIFMLLLVLSLIKFYRRCPLMRINEILKYISLWGAPLYFLLFLYGYFVSTYFLGVKMWLGNKTRFMALALNPHQIGMITGAMIFFTLYLIEYNKKEKQRIYYYMIIIVWYFISLTLKSDTLKAVYILLLLFYIVLLILNQIQNTYYKKNFLMLIFILALISLPFLLRPFVDRFEKFVAEAGNGDGRLELWYYSLKRLSERPIGIIVGMGPGGNTGLYMVASGHEMEAHNTYVQQLLNGGISIVIFYFIMIYKLLKNFLHKNIYLVLNILYFVLYGCGGNMNRRALMWFTYATVFAIFEKQFKHKHVSYENPDYNIMLRP